MTPTRRFALFLVGGLAACDAPQLAPDAAPPDGQRTPAAAECPAGSPPARFIAESPPPAVVAAGAQVVASVTFANCSGADWHAAALGGADGYKLGTDAPRDQPVWTDGTRVALPADVPAGAEIVIPIAARAPLAAGSFGWGWSIVHEGVAWLPSRSPLHTIQVMASSAPVALCDGVTADAGGVEPASDAIQKCIDGHDHLALPPGVYRVTSAIAIDHPFALSTAGAAGDPAGCLDANAPPCAVLRADENLRPARGFLRLLGTGNVTIDHLVLDGNRAHRLASDAANDCRAGVNGSGFNASAGGCDDCAFVGSASIDALCGSGFEWEGDRATITGSTFRGNGDHASANMWSDGLTLLRSNGATVAGNLFADNSDVDLILGGTTDGRVQANRIVQSAQASFAALMLDNFDGTTPGDFTGTLVDGNDVACGNRQCDFGIEIGPHPWYLSGNIAGGRVTNNTVAGAKIGIDVEGGGTDGNPIFVSGNDVAPSPSSGQFNCGQRPTTTFNVSPDSRVDLGAGPPPTATFQFHGCQ